MEQREDEIRTRAYELWQKAGCPEGKDHDFWQQAEDEMRGGATGQGPAQPIAPGQSDAGGAPATPGGDFAPAPATRSTRRRAK